MEAYEATFEIESTADAYAVDKVLTRLHDTLREEARTVRDGTTNSTAMLERFANVRDAAQNPVPGTLTVTLEHDGEPFEP